MFPHFAELAAEYKAFVISSCALPMPDHFRDTGHTIAALATILAC